jgi:uncharacterized membrane protein
LLVTEKGELTSLELEVLKTLEEHEILAKNPEADADAQLTPGLHLTDRVAAFGGSWGFIIKFTLVLLAWVFVNSFLLTAQGQGL